jgi:uncharacterized protein (DUF362 family)
LGQENSSSNVTRRKLLARAAKAGVCACGAGAAAYWLYDEKAPAPEWQKMELVTLPDFSVNEQPAKSMCIANGPDRVKTFDKAIDLLGGIERFIKPGDTVLIKPNVAFATPPILGATANPELIGRVVRLCYDRGGAKRVMVTDNSINDPASCFQLSGIGTAATQAGAKIIMPKPNLFGRTTLAGGKLIKNWPILSGAFEKVDKVIGITPVKNHHRSGASMTMKNWYGLLGGRRNIFHQNINTIIAELSMMLRPTFVVLDGTQVMMTNGPTGGSVSDLHTANTIIVSTDQVAADSFGSTLLNLTPADLPYLAKAQDAGAGTSDYASLKPISAEVAG